MRKFFTLVIALVLSITAVKAQIGPHTATFDTFALAGLDTFYVNYNNTMTDVGFNDGLLHFPCYYDTLFGGIWSSGFAYSNMTDVSDSSSNNLYTAVTAKGYNNSAQYCVVSAFDPVVVTKQDITAVFDWFYITNTLYAYKEMSVGGFSKKFGGVPNVDSDWFMLTIKGYKGGAFMNDSIDFYLADFRDPDSTKDYIVNKWELVSLFTLQGADSLQFSLSSSDTAGGFGMNNPAFFALDNFRVHVPTDVSKVDAHSAKIYPNPAVTELNIEFNDKGNHTLSIWDVSGKLITKQETAAEKVSINTSDYIPGMYILRIDSEQGSATVRFTKQ